MRKSKSCLLLIMGALLILLGGCRAAADKYVDVYGKVFGPYYDRSYGKNGLPAPVQQAMEAQGYQGTADQKGVAVVSSKPGNVEKDRMRRAQKMLADAGYEPGPADGIMGERTRSALRLYQKDHGLPVTGNLDDATSKQLGL